LKAPGTKRLKLKCDEPLSNFAFNFILRRYNLERKETRAASNTCRLLGAARRRAARGGGVTLVEYLVSRARAKGRRGVGARGGAPWCKRRAHKEEAGAGGRGAARVSDWWGQRGPWAALCHQVRERRARRWKTCRAPWAD